VTQIKTQCGPLTKIVAHPCFRDLKYLMMPPLKKYI
jgi:hypothetical protein